MKGKHIVISGANAGIGYATALGLLKKGAQVSMFCRSAEKAEQARKELIRQTGNTAIDIFIADMASWKSIKAACDSFKEKYGSIDVLLNNAGGTFSDYVKTEDGIEMTMAVNHFGYFVMTYHLLPLLKENSGARIINVSSKAHYGGKIDLQTINDEKGYFVFKQYEHSKLANVMFTKYLANKLKDKGITVNCLHPGVVQTKIGNKSGNKFHGMIWSLFAFFGINAEKGAETSIHLASSPDVASISGMYFDKKQPYKGSDSSNNLDSQNALWKWSEEQTDLFWEF